MHMVETAGPFEVGCSRLQSGNYVPGSCSDGRKLGIALGSGGLAGINQLGILSSLKNWGIFEVVDHWEGDSIGGINEVICVADIIDEAAETFYSLDGKKLIEPKRAMRIGGRALDLMVLQRTMEPILNAEKIEKITSSPIPINIGVTPLKPFSRMSVDLSKVEPEEVIPWTIRGAHFPILAGAAPRDRYGIPYADAGLSSLGPVYRAVQNGCTDIIFISCQPYSLDEKQAWQIGLSGLWAMRHDLAAIFKHNGFVDEQIENRKVFSEGHFKFSSANVYGFYPPMNEIKGVETEVVEINWPKLWTIEPSILKEGFERAAEYMKGCLHTLMPEFKPIPLS